MCRWLAAFVGGVLITVGTAVLAAEDDPFAEPTPSLTTPVLAPPPPLPAETEPIFEPPILLTPAPRPVLSTPLRPRPAPPEVTAAQQRVHDRAAQEALERKARIVQRRFGSRPAVQQFLPSEGWLVSRSLYPVDPGIRHAFRPIELSGLDPVPTVKPSVRRPAERKPHAITPLVIEPKPQE